MEWRMCRGEWSGGCVGENGVEMCRGEWSGDV